MQHSFDDPARRDQTQHIHIWFLLCTYIRRVIAIKLLNLNMTMNIVHHLPLHLHCIGQNMQTILQVDIESQSSSS